MAAGIRLDFGAGILAPVSAYSICAELKVSVRFVDVSMDGIYLPGPKPRILISQQRPLSRRHFSCAHELGHHLFGHAATIDELQQSIENGNEIHPDEFLVDAFAGHLLMPVVGIRNAFSRRGLKAATLRPEDIWAVATEFGVAYDALLTHMAYSLKDISINQRAHLIRRRNVLRDAELFGMSGEEICLLDEHFSAPTLDVEVGHIIIAPKGTVASCEVMVPLGETPFGIVYKANREGFEELSTPSTSWAATVRIAKRRYIGLAQFRYLEKE